MIALEIGVMDVVAVVKRDPYLPAGLLFFGLSSLGSFRMLRVVHEAGYRSIFSWNYIGEYMRRRKENEWPAWPVQLFWICLGLGVPLTFFGVFRL